MDCKENLIKKKVFLCLSELCRFYYKYMDDQIYELLNLTKIYVKKNFLFNY